MKSLTITIGWRAFSYFGRLLSRAQVVELQEILPDIQSHLTDEEYDQLLSLDLLMRGQLRDRAALKAGREDLWLAVEVSGVVDRREVERAQRRAALLRKAGLRVIAVAAGRQVTRGAQALARIN